MVWVRASHGEHETRQVLLAGVPGGFSWGSLPTDWLVSYQLK